LGNGERKSTRSMEQIKQMKSKYLVRCDVICGEYGFHEDFILFAESKKDAIAQVTKHLDENYNRIGGIFPQYWEYPDAGKTLCIDYAVLLADAPVDYL